MQTTKKTDFILGQLKHLYPNAICALQYEKDYELMIAVRLSAQCTDARVNIVAPILFERYPTLQSLSEANITDVEEIVKPCGFYHHKARDIILACQMLLSEYNGNVPDNMEDLLKLPGVGRKTANLLLGDLYGQEGYVCDTHCIRICERLGFTKGKDPAKVESQLRKIIPPEESSDFCHRIVLHGRAVCTARKPDCMHCTLAPQCDYFTGISDK